MTDHDPLCPQQHTHPKHDPSRCIFCEYGAAVREDERHSKVGACIPHYDAGYEAGRAAANDDVTFWEPHYQAGYTHGYGAALRDAVEAVEALCDCVELNGKHASFCAFRDVLPAATAIEALGGES